MKKLLLVVMSVMLCFSCIAFTGCKDEHTHNFGEWQVITPSTCETPGERTRKCDCGHTETEHTPTANHYFVYGVCVDCGAEE